MNEEKETVSFEVNVKKLEDELAKELKPYNLVLCLGVVRDEQILGSTTPMFLDWSTQTKKEQFTEFTGMPPHSSLDEKKALPVDGDADEELKTEYDVKDPNLSFIKRVLLPSRKLRGTRAELRADLLKLLDRMFEASDRDELLRRQFKKK